MILFYTTRFLFISDDFGDEIDEEVDKLFSGAATCCWAERNMFCVESLVHV